MPLIKCILSSLLLYLIVLNFYSVCKFKSIQYGLYPFKALISLNFLDDCVTDHMLALIVHTQCIPKQIKQVSSLLADCYPYAYLSAASFQVTL